MKEKVMFQKRDAQMLEAFRKLTEQFRIVSNMYEKRFEEMATCWREHRKELMSELDKENEDECHCSEFDYVDQFYAAVWDLRNFFQGKSKILQQEFERQSLNFGDVETLRKRNFERIAKLKEKVVHD